jgi:hypothetical protein
MCTLFTLRFSPESYELMIAGRSSGLSGFALTPSHPACGETVAEVCQKPCNGLTATGIAPELHGIPFSPPMENPWEEPANFRNKGKRCFGNLYKEKKFYFNIIVIVIKQT